MIANVSREVNVPSLAAEDAVNQYLMEHHEVCLEEVLSDAVDGRTHQSLAEVVQVTAGCLDRSRDEDGALTELYEGVLTVQGVRYGWRSTRTLPGRGSSRISSSSSQWTGGRWSG
jgi:hypothetical protein